MNSNSGWIFGIIAIAVLAIGGFFFAKSCNTPETTVTETRSLTKGNEDVTAKHTTDTVYRDRYFRQYIRVPAENILQYGKDSSRFDTTVISDSLTVRVAGTTFPAIDSLRLDIASILRYPVITNTDSIFIHRVDTLTIERIIQGSADLPWYDRFWTGALTTTILGLSLIIGLSQ